VCILHAYIHTCHAGGEERAHQLAHLNIEKHARRVKLRVVVLAVIAHCGRALGADAFGFQYIESVTGLERLCEHAALLAIEVSEHVRLLAAAQLDRLMLP
jgi:hypothetical protein